MPKSTDLEKTWKPGPATTTNLNTTGNLSIPYGRYRGVVSGKGAEGNAPNAATWNTNYNTAFPIANQPIANQPAATWNTNYNVAYPTGNQPVTGYNDQAFRYATQNQQYICQNGTVLRAENSHTYEAWSYHSCGQSWFLSPAYSWNYAGSQACAGLGYYTGQGNWNINCSPGNGWQQVNIVPGNPNYTTNYNTVYPIANRPAATWNTNYNTNYNTVYPLANQPAATYNLAVAGTPATIFGVPFPGAPASGTIGVKNPGPAVSATEFSYWSVQDDRTVEVTVPLGGNVTVTFE